MSTTMFKLRRPCAKCPFRVDIDGYLHRERAAEIARSLAGGSMFACHQTTVPDEEEDDLMVGPDSQFCAGALLVLEREKAPNQAMRMAEGFGFYNPEALDRSTPVHDSLYAFVRHHGTDDEVSECCCIVGVGCEAPAGLLVGGVVVPAEATGDVFECGVCGGHVCETCSVDGECAYCAESS